MVKKIKEWRDNNLTLKHIKIIMWVVCIIIVIISLIVEIKLWNSSQHMDDPISKFCSVFLPILILALVELELQYYLLERKYKLIDKLYDLIIRCKKNASIEVYLRKKLRKKIKEHDTRYFLTKKEDGLYVVYRNRENQRKVNFSLEGWKDIEFFDSRFTFTKEEE